MDEDVLIEWQGQRRPVHPLATLLVNEYERRLRGVGRGGGISEILLALFRRDPGQADLQRVGRGREDEGPRGCACDLDGMRPSGERDVAPGVGQPIGRREPAQIAEERYRLSELHVVHGNRASAYADVKSQSGRGIGLDLEFVIPGG